MFHFFPPRTGSRDVTPAVILVNVSVRIFAVGVSVRRRTRRLNIGQAEIDGIELAAATEAAGWILNVALTLQDPKDTSGDVNDGNQLPRRAEEILSLDADRDFGRWSFGASVRSQGDSFDDLGNFTELDGFTVVDLRAGLKVHKNWHLGIKVNNVFDEEYETAAFYPQDGTNVLATLRYVAE